MTRKIRINGLADVHAFCAAANTINGAAKILGGDGYIGNAKSLFSVTLAVAEWDGDLFISVEDYERMKVKEWIID